jgi:YVTN family beta-propeller protein
VNCAGVNPTKFITSSCCWLMLVAAITSAAEADAGGYLLVANKGDHTMGIIDTAAGKQIATVAEDGVTGHELGASPDGKLAFVPIYGNSGVGSPGTDGQLMRVIDIAKRETISTVDFGKGVRPHCVVIGPKDHLVYITTELDNAVTVVDPKTFKIVRTIPTGQPESHMLAITSDGKKGYTSNVGSGTVSVLDIPAGKVLDTIKVSDKAQRISLSVDDRYAFTADQTKPELAVIDTHSNKVTHRIPLPGLGYGTAPTPDGKSLVVAVPGKQKVAIVDIQAMKVIRTFDVPKAPQEVLVRPDGAEAYISCDASAQVAVLDLRNWNISKLILAGNGVDGLAWAAGAAKIAAR